MKANPAGYLDAAAAMARILESALALSYPSLDK
jgi:hypothetical protein